MKSFLIIDDHEIIRVGVKNVLKNSYESCIIVEADDEKSIITELTNQKFDLVIMDIHMPDTDASEIMKHIKDTYPKTKVLIFSMSDENIYAKKFLKSGAMGFVGKHSGVAELSRAIDLILNDKRYLSAALAETLTNEVGKKQSTNPFETLSGREIDIAYALIKGTAGNEIANFLKISTSAVGTYKTRIFTKLNVKNIAELIEIARIYNLV